ncbi:MAG: hypothetical protein CFH01_00215 [Alphaproteobacteria bacterium MarineAlpha2_Bin1]|nr:MAG: hypothetical protein CFH01_00215 [Alphaproteobacteria bacterium MarineAlpha2_Bin1]|tara:strand:+ start:1064 stop:1459 length:396 start_codon:yes stop_codon:yes gene_type:complete
MRFYSIFENPNVLSQDIHIFHKEGFSFFALILPLLFSIFNGLWMVSAFLILYFFILFSILVYFENFNSIIFIIILFPHIIFSFEARDLRKKSLIKKGWRKVGFVMGRNESEAEMRFYNFKNKIINQEKEYH